MHKIIKRLAFETARFPFVNFSTDQRQSKILDGKPSVKIDCANCDRKPRWLRIPAGNTSPSYHSSELPAPPFLSQTQLPNGNRMRKSLVRHFFHEPRARGKRKRTAKIIGGNISARLLTSLHPPPTLPRPAPTP